MMENKVCKDELIVGMWLFCIFDNNLDGWLVLLLSVKLRMDDI